MRLQKSLLDGLPRKMYFSLTMKRSLALAFLSVINIVGTAVGFVIPTVFVETDTDGSDKSMESVRDQFWMLLLFEFCLSVVAALLNLFFFAERPVNLPRYFRFYV
jgi:hypothetical protein